MKLEIKKAFKDVVSLKYFVPYMFIFTVITALGAIFSNTNDTNKIAYKYNFS